MKNTKPTKSQQGTFVAPKIVHGMNVSKPINASGVANSPKLKESFPRDQNRKAK